MSEKTTLELKESFLSGETLTEEKLHNLIDSLIHKSENDDIIKNAVGLGSGENAAPSVHASQHSALGEDPIDPRDIGAALAGGEGVNFVVVDVSSGSPSENGAALLAAYAAAKALTPNGAALSATNRAVVFLPPAVYDMGSQYLVMDTEFVDLIGLSPVAEHAYIKSTYGGTVYPFIEDYRGTLVQTANNVRICNLTLWHPGITSAGDGTNAAYCPQGGYADTYMENVVIIVKQRITPTRYISTSSFPVWNGTYVRVRSVFTVAADTDIAGWIGGSSSIIHSGTFIECDAGSGTGFGSFHQLTGKLYRCKKPLTAICSDGLFNGYAEDCHFGSWAFGSIGPNGVFVRCSMTNQPGGSNGFPTPQAGGKVRLCLNPDYSEANLG